MVPELQQRARQQREGAGLAGDVVHERVRELGLDVEGGTLRRADHGLTQLVAAERADQHVVRGEQARQIRVAGAAPVEVGPDRQDHGAPAAVAREPHELGEELGALILVAAGGERLLELVDREHHAAAGGEAVQAGAKLARRVLAGSDDRLRPALAAGQHARGEGGQQAGLHHRRLAASRWADHTEQRRADQAGDELGDQPFAAEEVRRVVGLERREALERADHRALVLIGGDGLACALQLDDPAHELLLHRPQLGAACSRRARDRLDPACRLAARPRARDVVDAARDAAARVQQRARGHVLGGLVVDVCQGDRAHGLLVERLERQGSVRLHAGQRCRALRDRHHERRAVRELAQRGSASGPSTSSATTSAGRVASCAPPRAPIAAGPEAYRTLAPSPWASRASSATRRVLPIPRGPARATTVPATGARLVPAIPQPRELDVAPGEVRRRHRIELARQLGRRRRQPERGIVAQDRRLKLPQLRTRVDADLVRELAVRVVIGVEGLRLPAGSVQREHEQTRQPLAGGMLGDQPPQVGDELRVPARGERGLHPDLDRRQPLLLEPLDVALREPLEGEVGERRSTPQRERLAQDGRRVVRAVVAQRAAAVVDQPLEPLGVELARLDVEAVAGGRGRHDVPVAERLAQARDMDLDRPHRARRRLVTPQRLGELLRAHRLVGPQQQHGQDSALLRTAQRDDGLVPGAPRGAQGCGNPFRPVTLSGLARHG